MTRKAVPERNTTLQPVHMITDRK